ncbi:Uncharacterized protein Fot_38233 [Forsythia ovata]|uniref:Uncharacterized protein n=1 Tax=Forsythia ovata TaxID=205694 RepID=A0ABD1S1Z3_9LAMI
MAGASSSSSLLEINERRFVFSTAVVSYSPWTRSNFLPKDYDAATREFYSSVTKRTRSKRKIYVGVAHRNSYSSGDVEEINTDHGLDETFAPNACRKEKKTVRQSQGNSSSCKNVEDKLGNRNEDVNSKDIVIEKIDKAEFRNKRMHSASEKGSSIRQQLRGDSAANLLILAV